MFGDIELSTVAKIKVNRVKLHKDPVMLSNSALIAANKGWDSPASLCLSCIIFHALGTLPHPKLPL